MFTQFDRSKPFADMTEEAFGHYFTEEELQHVRKLFELCPHLHNDPRYEELFTAVADIVANVRYNACQEFMKGAVDSSYDSYTDRYNG